MMRGALAGCIFLILFPLSVIAQMTEGYRLDVKKATDKILLDGVLSESSWEEADVARDFYQQFPYDTSFARSKTEVRVTFDEQNIYFGITCLDETPGEYIVQSLKRDFSFPVSDAVGVFLDPFSDKTNGFSFAVNPLGVQREGLVENGGNWGVTTIWDNKWFSKVSRMDDRWVAELAIPFKTLRYDPESTSWGVNFARNDLKVNETSTWVPVPRVYNVATLAFTGQLIFLDPLPSPGANVALIPFVAGGAAAVAGEDETDVDFSTGLDAKIGVTPSLNLDLTVYPDFSQVEVDQQVTNLERFSIFFPERRGFFIENSDLFARFGFSKIRPFFSRRIGLYQGNQIPIIGGARLSGKAGKNWRIGLMNMQTEGDAELGLEPQNYTVAAVQRQVFGRSNIGGIFVNRQAFSGTSPEYEDYNRVVGIDYNLYSNDNRWRGIFFYHRSFSPNTSFRQDAQAAYLGYNTQNLSLAWNHEYVGENYNAEVGFVPRTGYFRLEPMAAYTFYPKKGPFRAHGPEAYSSIYWNVFENDELLLLTDRYVQFGYDLQLQNRSAFEMNVSNTFLRLTFPFDATGTGSTPLPVGDYEWNAAGISYVSDFRKKFTWSGAVNYGGYYNGTRLNYSAELNFRAQPWGIFTLAAEQNYIELPDPYPTRWLTLIGPKIQLSFTKNLFLTTFIQYNTQIDNLNINTRFQWRFAPMSDLFIVFTDNYNPYNLSIKERALAIKLNYWLTS